MTNKSLPKTKLDVEDLTRRQWHYIHKRFRSPFYTYLLWEGLSHHLNKDLRFAYEMPGILYLDKELMFFKNIWDKKQKEVLRESQKNSNFISEIFKKSYSLDKKIVNLANLIKQQKLSRLNDAELLKYFKRYLSLSLSASAFMIFPLFVENFLEKEIAKAVKKKYGAGANQIIQILSTPQKLSSTQQEEISLLKIIAGRLKVKNLAKAIKNHTEKYGWLKNASFTGDFYKPKDIIKKINDLTPTEATDKLKSLIKNQRNLKNSLNKICRELNDKQTEKLIDILQESIYFRSWRTERYYRNAQYLQNFFIKIANRINLNDPNDIFFLLPAEIIAALKREYIIDNREILNRQSGYIMLADGKNTNIFTGSIIKRAIKKIKFLKEDGSQKDLKGQTAFPGKVKGRARVIKSSKDFSAFKTGDILISHSTTPDYVPIIKKAAAIVTDEGGVLSHASVISREMRVPCVIGTAIATKKIKNDDIIEVDADLGIIRIVNRK